MTWAQRVRKVFAQPSAFLNLAAEKNDLLLEALEMLAGASVRAEYEPQIQKIREELEGLKQKESQRYPRYMAFDYADPFPSIRLERGRSPLDQMLAEKLELARAYELLKPVQPVVADSSKTILDSLCSLMSCGADEVLGLVTEYRAAYDRYSVLAERLGVELSHLNADSEVTQAFDNLRAREAAYLHILDALGVQNAGDSVIRIDRLKQQVVDVENHNIALRRQNEDLLQKVAELSKPSITFGLNATEAIAELEEVSAVLKAMPEVVPSKDEKPPAEPSGEIPERKPKRTAKAAEAEPEEPKVPEAALRPDRTLKELDWVQCAQVFTKIAAMADRAIGSIPEHRLPASQALEFRRLYSAEIVAYRTAPNPDKPALLVEFQNARRDEEWRPKAPK